MPLPFFLYIFFFFNDTATTEIYTLSLHDALPICPAPSGPQRCTDVMLVGCADLAEELDLPIHIHVLETRMQAVSGQQLYGRTLVEHMDAIGFLGPRVCFAHAIWLTPSDMELVRDRDVSIAHNPVSNMKLGSGI